MTLNMNYRGWSVVCAILIGSTVAIIGFVSGAVETAAIFLAIQGTVLGFLLWWTRPGDGPSYNSHAEALAAAGESDVIVYWMPDCIFCDLLKRGLGRARQQVSWVNILSDPEAADFVRTYRDGDASVPTAVTGSGQMINATPAAIKAQLRMAG
ncbi:MAG: glutaredoxin family protein [Acidimicrobiales bacterium]